MTNIRALRLSYGLSLIDLALLCDIPARTLAEIEYGIQRLDYESRSRLARVFDTVPEQLWAGNAPQEIAYKADWRKRTLPVLAIVFVAVLLLLDALWIQLSPSASASARAAAATDQLQAAPSGVPQPAVPTRPALLAVSTARPTAALAARATPTEPASPTQPAPTFPPRFVLAQDGPHGCPLAPEIGRVIMTQGYDGDTHVPANIWGAVDLAIDGDGDGYPEPSATQGVPIFATHSGVVHVTPNSWPGGNFVRVVDEQAGWSSAYAHLDSILVTEGQAISAGMPIGAVGSSGMASGPHLHYEVWHGDENIDPSGLIEC